HLQSPSRQNLKSGLLLARIVPYAFLEGSRILLCNTLLSYVKSLENRIFYFCVAYVFGMFRYFMILFLIFIFVYAIGMFRYTMISFFIIFFSFNERMMMYKIKYSQSSG